MRLTRLVIGVTIPIQTRGESDGPTDAGEGCQDAFVRGRLRQFRAGEIGSGRAIAYQGGLLDALQPAPGRRDQ